MPVDSRAEFDRCWPLIEAGMQKDIGGEVYTKDEIWSEIDKGEAHLWTGPKSACVAEVIERETTRYLNIYVLGGKLTEIMTLLWPDVEQWGRDNGCSTITGSGRAVWGRVLGKYGFQPVLTMFAKEL